MEAQSPSAKPLVMVTWDDTEDSSEKWLDDAEVTKFVNETCAVVSVGFLLSDTTKYVTIGRDHIEKLGHYGGVIKIPKGMVLAMVTLNGPTI